MPFTLIKNPLISQRLISLRNKSTSHKEFRQNLSEIALFMLPTVVDDLRCESIQTETPLGIAQGVRIVEEVILIPILRSGLGMVRPFEEFLPNPKISYFDINRDPESLMPKMNRSWLHENLNGECAILIDPMLATGRILSQAVQLVKEKNVGRVKVLSLIASTQGVDNLLKNHPDVQLYLVAIDDDLDESGYIVPGLGDAGDRLTGFNLTSPH
ncbi:uracil phosphoribosyltransferase [Candidatus Leptofilum sp.]|uniref:uracil phosphoribosyltransferase n=1 Tax=Candidatus Leptofilum sp. TaxID=3241576 RepID=UPI003B5B136C